MTLKPSTWFSIAVLLTAINAISFPFTSGAHAGVHAVLAIVCAVWAGNLQRSIRATPVQRQVEGQTGQEDLEALEGDMDQLRRELSETQERLDFAERLLAKRPDGELKR